MNCQSGLRFSTRHLSRVERSVDFWLYVLLLARCLSADPRFVMQGVITQYMHDVGNTPGWKWYVRPPLTPFPCLTVMAGCSSSKAWQLSSSHSSRSSSCLVSTLYPPPRPNRYSSAHRRLSDNDKVVEREREGAGGRPTRIQRGQRGEVEPQAGVHGRRQGLEDLGECE